MIGFAAKKVYVKKALESGAKISLLISKNKYKKEYEELFHKVLVIDDIYNWQQLQAIIDQSQKIDAVLTRHENYVSVVGAINQYLGLKGIDYQTSRNFCNKYLMKQAWQKNAVPCAEGICLEDLTGLDDFLRQHAFPLILKKTSAVHSNFVVKVQSREDLLQKLEFLKTQAEGHITSKPVVGYGEETKECHFLLEEMLVGRELTLDSFVSNGVFTHTPICEYVLAKEIGIDDSYLPIRTMPALLSIEQEKQLISTVEQALRALSAQNCVCHSELFFDEKKDNYQLIEATPRGGGNRAEMTLLTTGYDYSLAVFQAAAGLKIKQINRPSRAVSVVEYFAKQKGVIESIDLTFLEQNRAVSNIKLGLQIGAEVEQAKFGGKAIASFFVEAKDPLESRNLAIDLFKQLQVAIKINYFE